MSAIRNRIRAVLLYHSKGSGDRCQACDQLHPCQTNLLARGFLIIAPNRQLFPNPEKESHGDL